MKFLSISSFWLAYVYTANKNCRIKLDIFLRIQLKVYLLATKMPPQIFWRRWRSHCSVFVASRGVKHQLIKNGNWPRPLDTVPTPELRSRPWPQALKIRIFLEALIFFNIIYYYAYICIYIFVQDSI